MSTCAWLGHGEGTHAQKQRARNGTVAGTCLLDGVMRFARGAVARLEAGALRERPRVLLGRALGTRHRVAHLGDGSGAVRWRRVTWGGLNGLMARGGRGAAGHGRRDAPPRGSP